MLKESKIKELFPETGTEEIIRCHGVQPYPLHNATLTAVNTDLYLFGGLDANLGWSNILWLFDSGLYSRCDPILSVAFRAFPLRSESSHCLPSVSAAFCFYPSPSNPFRCVSCCSEPSRYVRSVSSLPVVFRAFPLRSELFRAFSLPSVAFRAVTSIPFAFIVFPLLSEPSRCVPSLP